jgi:hypothetical protein
MDEVQKPSNTSKIWSFLVVKIHILGYEGV